MLYFYYAIMTKDEAGRLYSYILKVNQNTNLLSKLNAQREAVAVTPCKTKKEAVAIVDAWNDAATINNNSLFSKNYGARVTT